MYNAPQFYSVLWKCLFDIEYSILQTFIYWTSTMAYLFWYKVEPLWKGQERLTEVAKFGPFPRTILYKSCLFYPSWQATSFERPPSWVAFIEGFHCIYIWNIYNCLFMSFFFYSLLLIFLVCLYLAWMLYMLLLQMRAKVLLFYCTDLK